MDKGDNDLIKVTIYLFTLPFNLLNYCCVTDIDFNDALKALINGK